MNVLCYVPCALTNLFQNDLELIQQSLDQGDSVSALVCNGELAACHVNPSHNPSRCIKCYRTRDVGFSRLPSELKVFPLPSLSNAELAERAAVCDYVGNLDNADQLRAWQIENFDIGYAVLSSAVSITRDPLTRLARQRDLITRLTSAAWTAYTVGQRFLREHAVDQVYLFNGRFADYRGMLRACEASGIPFATHERGCDLNHYELYPNVMPHDIRHAHASIQCLWNAADPELRVAAGHRWFEERVRGIDRTSKSFVKNQDPDRLPDDWDPQRHNVAVFISSEDEFVAIGDHWSGPIYASQLEGLQKILNSLHHANRDVRLYLRIHPNLSGVDNEQTRGLPQLQSPLLVTIPPDSPVSTYHLMRSADTTLSFGSTAGIEAAYWRRPSVLAGMSFYRDLGATYNPVDHDELVAQLQVDLPELPLEPALRFGHYMATFGQPYQYFQPTGLITGTFQGKSLKLPFRARMESRLCRWFGRRSA